MADPRYVLAVAYCRAIGRDPDEQVHGYERVVPKRWIAAPRWWWMLGAHPALADGALALSPKQRALGHRFAR